jgi:GNAT superfamily N-acetyltransferase
MFATGSLARRIERAEAAGLGFEGVPEENELGALELAYAARSCPVMVELSSFADPAVGRLLTRRGYELIGYENVSGLLLQEVEPQGRSPDGGLTIARVGDPATSDEWLEAITTGFLHPDTYDGLASHESYSRDVAERSIADIVAGPGFERYLARRGGVVAGGAGFRTFEGVAQLCGSATLPEHRRQGVQSALLRHRLSEAQRLGCDLAVVVTSPGSKSQQNVERFGFSLLYVRAILVREFSKSQKRKATRTGDQETRSCMAVRHGSFHVSLVLLFSCLPFGKWLSLI